MVIQANRMKFPRILTEIEVAQMLKAAEPIPRDFMMIKCLYYLGLKCNELLKMTTNDIDFQDNVVKVPGTNERNVMIPGAFTFELEKYVKGKEGIVFAGRGSAGTLSDRHIRRMVKQYAKQADVRNYEEIKPNTLRVSYAAHLRKDGISVKNIEKIMGHARRETTYIYSHGLQKMASENSENTDSNEKREENIDASSEKMN